MSKTKTPRTCWKDYDNPYELSYTNYINIIKTGNIVISDLMIKKGEGFNMPKGLGILQILKWKPNKVHSINFNLYNKEGLYLPFNNKHSEGFMGKFNWKKPQRPSFKFTKMFKFKPTR